MATEAPHWLHTMGLHTFFHHLTAELCGLQRCSTEEIWRLKCHPDGIGRQYDPLIQSVITHISQSYAVFCPLEKASLSLPQRLCIVVIFHCQTDPFSTMPCWAFLVIQGATFLLRDGPCCLCSSPILCQVKDYETGTGSFRCIKGMASYP